MPTHEGCRHSHNHLSNPLLVRKEPRGSLFSKQKPFELLMPLNSSWCSSFSHCRSSSARPAYFFELSSAGGCCSFFITHIWRLHVVLTCLIRSFYSPDARDTNKKRSTLMRLLRGLKTVHRKTNQNSSIPQNKVSKGMKFWLSQLNDFRTLPKAINRKTETISI